MLVLHCTENYSQYIPRGEDEVLLNLMRYVTAILQYIVYVLCRINDAKVIFWMSEKNCDDFIKIIIVGSEQFYFVSLLTKTYL